MPKPTKKLTIELNNSYKSFKTNFKTTLEGDLIVLTGVNGSGKSQLLDIIGTETLLRNNSEISPHSIVKINDSQILEADILHKSFKNISQHKLNEEDTNYKKRQVHEIFGFYVKNQNYQPYERSAKHFSELAIKSGFHQLIGTLNSEQIEKVLNDNPDFNWQSDDIFNYDNLSSLFLDYLNKETDYILEKKNQSPIDSIKEYRNKKEPPWLILNNIFSELGFEYRFKSDYKLKTPNIEGGVRLLNKNETTLAFEINDLSDGEKAIFSLVISSLKSTMEGALPKILLLDEYDATFNPSLTEAFYKILIKFFVKKDVIVVLTTHNPITATFAPSIHGYDTTFYEMYKESENPLRIVKKTTEELQEISEVKIVLEKFYPQTASLQKKVHELENEINKLKIPSVICTGKTDPIHLKSALKHFHKNKEFRDVFESFFVDLKSADSSDSTLNAYVQTRKKENNQIPKIAIFDRDDLKTIKNCISENEPLNYKDNGNNIHCFVIPESKYHDDKNISIEFLYSEAEIKSLISKRRLYIGTEFKMRSGKLKTNNLINIQGNKKNKFVIVDTDVFDENEDNIALSKNEFAEAIYNGKIKISNESWENFRPIFKLIEEIINSKPSTEEKLDDKQSE